MTETVLIVGAGPTGLTAAVELARLGARVTVIDRKPAPSALSRAVGILPSSMRILEPSGAATAIRAEAILVDRVLFHFGMRRVAALDMHPPRDAPARLHALAQDRTEHHLAESLARYGGAVRFGAEFETLEQDHGHVNVRIAGREEAYDLVVGADGTGSRVRQALGLAFEGYDLSEEWSIADVDAQGWPHPQAFHIYLLSGGHGVIVVPLEAERFRLISNTADALAALPVPMTVRRVRRAGRFRVCVRQVPRYRIGRVFLAGDAAHCHSPVGGRGMNLGIADAADLARRLAEGDGAGYGAARKAEGRRVIALSESARRLVMSRNPAKRTLLRAGLTLADRVPPLGRTVARRVLEV